MDAIPITCPLYDGIPMVGIQTAKGRYFSSSKSRLRNSIVAELRLYRIEVSAVTSKAIGIYQWPTSLRNLAAVKYSLYWQPTNLICAWFGSQYRVCDKLTVQCPFSLGGWPCCCTWPNYLSSSSHHPFIVFASVTAMLLSMQQP